MVNIKFIIFLIYVLFGVYFLNKAFSFISISDFITKFDSQITLIAGILLIWGSLSFLKKNKSDS